MKVVKFIGSIVIVFFAGFIGSLATTPNIASWYSNLDKPFFTPPNWLFGPVWTLLYLLMAISLYLVLTTRATHSKKHAYTLFVAQLILNTLWSVVFFGLHQPWLAFVIILLLLFGIIFTMSSFRTVRPMAAYLLVPYLLWVSFAACLNLAIAILN